jgi:antitoxin (DNA-binding transcriptional repressor) of toxin-antitoxin stability system
MQVISAREFRSNQTAVLSRALNGESILLTSRVGKFKIVPVKEDDTLTDRICEGLREVKMIESGELEGLSLDELLNEI